MYMHLTKWEQTQLPMLSIQSWNKTTKLAYVHPINTTKHKQPMAWDESNHKPQTEPYEPLNTNHHGQRSTILQISFKCFKKPHKICTKWASNLENSYQIRNACNDFEIFCTSSLCHEYSTCKRSNLEWCKCYVNKNAPIQCQKCDTNCHIFLYVSKMMITCEKKIQTSDQ